MTSRTALVEDGIAAIAADRVHGSGYLARKALGILGLLAGDERARVGARLTALRPEMPAIAAAVAEAVESGDIPAVIRRADAERRRVARAAMRALRRRRVATISNSSLVARAIVYAGPVHTQVVVDGRDDEGHLLAADLKAAGLDVSAVELARVDADVAVVGCDAVFDDGSFVNRRGTLALVERLPTLVLIDRWKRIGGRPPVHLPDDEAFELVPGDRVHAPA